MPRLSARDNSHSPRLTLGLPLLLAAALLTASCAHTEQAAEREVDLRGSLALQAVGADRFQPQTLAGRVVLVNFFATWCFPCLQELPVLKQLQEHHASRGFTVVAVGMDLEGGKVLRPFRESYALPYPVLVADDALRAGETSFGRIRELPTNVLLDGEGRVLAAWSGLAPPERLNAVVEAALRRH